MGCVSVYIVALVVHLLAIPVCDDGIGLQEFMKSWRVIGVAKQTLTDGSVYGQSIALLSMLHSRLCVWVQDKYTCSVVNTVSMVSSSS